MRWIAVLALSATACAGSRRIDQLFVDVMFTGEEFRSGGALVLAAHTEGVDPKHLVSTLTSVIGRRRPDVVLGGARNELPDGARAFGLDARRVMSAASAADLRWVIAVEGRYRTDREQSSSRDRILDDDGNEVGYTQTHRKTSRGIMSCALAIYDGTDGRTVWRGRHTSSLSEHNEAAEHDDSRSKGVLASLNRLTNVFSDPSDIGYPVAPSASAVASVLFARMVDNWPKPRPAGR